MEVDWRSKTPSLGESLGHIFSTGFYSDVAFLVGEEEFRINAHKTILSARSEPLATMFLQRWASKTEQEIKMPQNNLLAVKHFLKFLYTDLISFENVEVDDILELTHLAHMYQVHKLLGECIVHLTANISEKNCLQIHKSCQLLDKNLSDKALEFFLANVVPIAKSNDAYLSWDCDTMEKILLDDRAHVPEPILFKALLKWRDVDSSRNDDFRKLSRLIRFPTMSPKDFASEVVTSGVLSNEEMLEVFCYISTQTGTVKFPTKHRKLLVSTINYDDHLEICGSPESVYVDDFLAMLEYPGRNFHKFSFTLHNCSGYRSTNIKLHGIKFLNFGVNNEDLMAHLQSLNFKIKVAVTFDEDKRTFGATKVLERTITGLNGLGMRAYFEPPVAISQNQTCSIATNITLATGTHYNGDAIGRLELSEVISSSHQQSFYCDGIHGKVAIEGLEGSYSLINGLLFSPPDDSEDCGDCNIS